MTDRNPDDLVPDFRRDDPAPDQGDTKANPVDDSKSAADTVKRPSAPEDATREHDPTAALKQPAAPQRRQAPITRRRLDAVQPGQSPRRRGASPGLIVALVILFVLMLLAGGAILLGLTRVSSGLSAALTTSPTITLTAIGGGATHTLTPAVALTVLPAKTGLPPTPTVTPTVPITPSPALPTAPPVPTAIPTINAPTLAAPTEQTGSGISQAGITLITVAGGAFMMGSDANPAEKPVHSVGLAPFYIDQFEVTNAAWAACVAAGACHLPGSTESYDHKPYYGVDAYNNYPVVFVSWYSAGAYCRWRGARLPSEAEWEMAARWNPGSGATSVYPWGDDWNPANLNACDASCLLSGSAFKDPQYDDGQPQMAPVGSFPMDVSSLGVSDMGGNVAEWVADGYDAAYYAVSPAENPTGPATGAEKVVRGGSWSLDKNWARGAARSHFGPLAQFAGIGFRCALTAAAQ